RIARALLGLKGGAVPRLMLRDERGWPNPVATRELRQCSHNSWRRGVAHVRSQIRPVSVAKAREWRIDRSDFQVHAATLERQHLRVAKCLRNYRISGIEIAKAHRHQ